MKTANDIRISDWRSDCWSSVLLAPCPPAVCASPAYLRKHGRPKTVIDLGDHRCLGYTLSHAVGPSSCSFGSNGNIKVPVSGPLRAGNGDALVAAAIADRKSTRLNSSH